MLTTEAVGLAITVAKGLIKLSNRLDKTQAERAAVTGPIAMPQTVNQLLPKQGRMIRALGELLANEPDLPTATRNRIQRVLDSNGGNPETAGLQKLMDEFLPDQARGRLLDVDGQFMKDIRAAGFDTSDPDVRVSLFYVKAELSEGEKGYTWRIALTVVDVLAEFGAENTGLFVRDEKVQAVVGAVLARFGETDLQTAESWSGLLRKALSATLEGALDARGTYDVDSELLAAVLDGLVAARAAMPKEQRDNFVLGLFQGKGYPRLVGTLMESAANELGGDDASAFALLASDVLKEGAKLVKAEESFEAFFRDHWGDLVRAGFASLATHGPALTGNKPLASDVVVAIAGVLAATEDRRFLTGGTLVAVVDASVDAVASHPDVLKGAAQKKWIGELVDSVVQTVADQGVVATFGSDGATKVLKDALGTFGANPALIVARPGLVQELVGGVLTSVGGVERLTAKSLADAAVSGALGTIADHPELLDVEYPKLVAGFAGQVSELVAKHTITGLQGERLLAAITASVAENPALLADLEKAVVNAALSAVLSAAVDDDTKLLAGVALADTLQHVVVALGKFGRAKIESEAADALITQLETVLDAGLTRAGKELGNRMGRSSLPNVLGDLVAAWARGEVGEVDADTPNFKRFFGELAARAVA